MNSYSTNSPQLMDSESSISQSNQDENMIILPSLAEVSEDANEQVNSVVSSSSQSQDTINNNNNNNLDLLSGIKASYTNDDEYSRKRKNLYNFDEMPVTDMPTITDQADRDPWLENLSPQLRQLYLKKMRQELGLLDDENTAENNDDDDADV